MNTLYAIIGLFGIGAVIGIYLLALILQNKETPKSIAFIHGIFVVVAFIMLIIYAFRHPPGPLECIVLFTIAVAGGVVVIHRDITGKGIPKWLAVTHGVIAVAGFIFLLVYTFIRH